jgi:dihydrofolate reductase
VEGFRSRQRRRGADIIAVLAATHAILAPIPAQVMSMSRTRVLSFGISLDGFGAGPNQGLQNPLGERFLDVMGWFLQTDVWKRMHGMGEGEKGIDNDVAKLGFDNIGAWILGRNMFGPVRGPWPDERWKGWWGDEPPYRVPVFVLTHHARAPIEMKGGTVFHFVTDGIESALAQAKAAAGGRDVRIGGGASTVRQYVQAGLVDEVHLAMRPVLLGSGEPLFAGLDWRAHGYECEKSVAGERATHFFLRRKA